MKIREIERKMGASFVFADAESPKVGDRVHLGFGTKGGAGFSGVITKIEGTTVHIKNNEGKEYSGPLSKVSADTNRKDTELDKRGDRVVYKNYLIMNVGENEYTISRGGSHIGYAKSVEEAKREIDGLQ